MEHYRLAGQDFYFLQPVPELKEFQTNQNEQGTAEEAVLFFKPSILSPKTRTDDSSSFSRSRITQTTGWVGGAFRGVKVSSGEDGILLDVEGGGEFLISPGGKAIGKAHSGNRLTRLDYEILAGSVITLALAIRGIWSLHASAVRYKGNLIVILGESGQGKSTLAASLNGEDWQLVSDDILPVQADPSGLIAWPHFPQLKLQPDDQPWRDLPEKLPVDRICLLSSAEEWIAPELRILNPGEIVKAILAHTAGTRLYPPGLLEKHLDFCTQAAGKTAAVQLTYPHNREALPIIKGMLESLC